MVQINFAKREVQCKVVFYGPAMSGKTANLRAIHARSPEHVRGALTTIATDQDRTLFFDFLPLNLGLVAGIQTKINLYAVPYITGQNATRLLVLEGIDGIVFVADSSRKMLQANMASLENLRDNLSELGRELDDIPIVFQWNKSDAEDAMTSEELERSLNPANQPAFVANADTGTGIFKCLKAITQNVLIDVAKAMSGTAAPAARPAVAAVAPGQKGRDYGEPPPQRERRALAPAPEPTPTPEPEPEPLPQISVGSQDDAPAPWEDPEYGDVAHAETGDFVDVAPLQAVQADDETGDFEPLPSYAEPATTPEERVAAEYEAAFGRAPEPDVESSGAYEPPPAVLGAAEDLQEPPPALDLPALDPVDLDFDDPAPPAWKAPTPAPEPTPAPDPDPGGPKMVAVGGHVPRQPYAPKEGYDRGWESATAESQERSYGRRQANPVVERMIRPKIADRDHVPTANIVAGAICALFSLAAIGYVVIAML